MPRKVRALRKTVFIVCEGHVEKAFLGLLREYYSKKKFKVTIKNEKGGGPANIIGGAIKESDTYDISYVVIDSDITIPKTLLKRAGSKKINVIINVPCVEGTMLMILEGQKPERSKECKDVMDRYIPRCNRTEKAYHKRVFSKDLLERKRDSVDALDSMILIMSGEKKI